MPSYRIHRLKDTQRQQFRWAPHTSGLTTAKPKDYDLGSVIESATVYSAWEELRAAGHPLQVGDLLEREDGSLSICKYIGFEEARWFIPEPLPQPAPASPEVTLS